MDSGPLEADSAAGTVGLKRSGMTLRLSKPWLRAATLSVLIVVVLALTACGGGGGMGSEPGIDLSPAPTSSAFRLNMGDAPADRVISFQMTVNSVALTDSSGNTVTVMSAPTSLEFTHLAGTMQPMMVGNIPQDTYTRATISVSSPRMLMMDPVTGQMVATIPAMTATTATINFTPPFTMGSTPGVLNCDFNLAGSMTVDGMGNVTITPMFQGSFMMMGPQDDQGPEDGAMEDLWGFVSSVSGSSFTLSVEHMSQALTFATDASTQFEGIGGMSQLTSGMMAEVDAVTRPDGSLYARKVEVRMSTAGGMMDDHMGAQGVVTEVTGNPATQLTLLVHYASSHGTMMPDVGRTLDVAIAADTEFAYDSDYVDLSGLPFTPRFDVATVVRAQKVEVDTDSGMGHMGDAQSLTAEGVELKRQALNGTVSALVESGQQATFTLTVPADSVFAQLAGATTIAVFKQGGTEIRDVTLADGAAVRVRGLLFFDSGTYRLVASQIMAP